MVRAISLAALTVLEVSPVEAVRIAARNGYSHVGLRCVPATPEELHFPILSDLALRRELKSVIAGEGICVLDTEIVRIKSTMDWGVTESAIAFSSEFGATRLLVADNDPDPARSHDTFAKMADLASGYDVTPHLEFMPWTCAPNLAAAQSRIDGIANGALLIDAFHLARSGGQASDIIPGDSMIGYVQLCDIAGPIPAMDRILQEARSDRLFPGEGEIDLLGLLQRLPDIPISLEVPADRLRDAGWTAEARASRAMETTRALLEKVGEVSRL